MATVYTRKRGKDTEERVAYTPAEEVALEFDGWTRTGNDTPKPAADAAKTSR